MIFLLVTTHPSKRLPGKNDALFHFTADWAAIAAQHCGELVTMVHIGPLPAKNLPLKWLHLDIDEGSHYDDIASAEEMLAPDPHDVFALAQVTQPLRSRHLLADAVARVRSENQPLITVQKMPARYWRLTDDFGRRPKKDEFDELVHDGSLFAWLPGQLPAIFDHTAKKSVLEIDRRWGLIDIDVAGDIPPALPALWADSL